MRGFLTFQMMLFIVIFGLLMLLPVIGAALIEPFKYIMMGYFCILIYTFVRNIIGGGSLTYIISAILIYIFVINLWPLFAAGYMLYMIIGFGLSGIIIFALPAGKGGAAAVESRM